MEASTGEGAWTFDRCSNCGTSGDRFYRVYLSTRDAANLLGLHRSVLIRLLRAGILKGYRAGGGGGGRPGLRGASIRVSTHSIQRYIETRSRFRAKPAVRSTIVDRWRPEES